MTPILQGASFSAICRTNGGTWSIRTRATVGSSLKTLSRASAPHSDPLLFVLPFGGSGKLARRLKRINPLRIAAGLFLQTRRDRRSGLLNFCRPQAPAGKVFSFLNSLLKHRQEPRSGFTETFRLTPVVHVLSLSASSHGKHHDSRSVGNAQNRVGEVRNAIR